MANETQTFEPITVELAAAELPDSIVSRFPKRPPADARFAVTVELAETEAEKFAALQRDLQAGFDDLAASRASDAQQVFARLKVRFPPA